MRSIFFISSDNRPTFHASGVVNCTAVHHTSAMCQAPLCCWKVMARGGQSSVCLLRVGCGAPLASGVVVMPVALPLAWSSLLSKSSLLKCVTADQNWRRHSHFCF